MGAKISGAGTHVIEIEGVDRLHGAEHEVIPDRIEAGSMMAAAAITGGDVTITNAPIEHLDSVATKLREAGVTVEANGEGIRVARLNGRKSVELRTLPYPGFPTDLQAQMMAMRTHAGGTSVVTGT